MKTNLYYLLALGLVVCGTTSCRQRTKTVNNENVVTSSAPKVEVVVEKEKEPEGIDASAEEIINKIKTFYENYVEYGEKVESFIGVTKDFRPSGDYDIFSQSQDPNDHYTVSVSKSSSIKNGFDVKWKEQWRKDYGDNENIHLVWVFAYEDGQWKLDNVLEE